MHSLSTSFRTPLCVRLFLLSEHRLMRKHRHLVTLCVCGMCVCVYVLAGIRPNAHTYVHRHQTQRPHQYKKYKKRQVYRPWSEMSAATVLETNASSEGTPNHLFLPPGRDFPTPKGYSFIVPDVEGKTLPDGRTAPPPSLLALQELSLSKPLLSLQGLSAEYRLGL